MIAEEIGFLRIAVLSASLGSAALLTLERSRSARLGHHLAEGDDAGVRSEAGMLSLASFAWSLGCLFGMYLLGKPLIEVAFGTEYLPAYIPAVILLVAAAVQSACGPSGMLMYLVHDEKRLFVLNIVFLAVTLVLFWIFTPDMSAWSAALAMALAIAGFNLSMCIYFLRRHGINPSAFRLA